MNIWESENQRLWDPDQEYRNTEERIQWGVLHLGDPRVRNTFTSERGARQYVERHSDAQLVRQVVEVETIETYNDWEIQS